MKNIGIIGAGASGIMAALESSKNGANVVLFERKDRIGKKILVTGNGRCNFTNANMSQNFYYCEDDSFVQRTLETFSNNDLIHYFNGLGLLIHERNGYFYPASDQASSVLDVLRFALAEKHIDIKTDSFVTRIQKNDEFFDVFLENGDKYSFDAVIISCGGKSGLGKKEIPNGYDLLKNLGISITPLYPALTQIKCSGINFKALSGVKSDASVYLFVDDELTMSQRGELLFNDSGISGIVSFQLSHCVAMNIDANKDVKLILDLLPGISADDLGNFVNTKFLLHGEQTVEEFFTGFHNKKLLIEIIKKAGLKLSQKVKNIDKNMILDTVLSMKELLIVADGVNDFDSSQVTAGGVPTSLLTDQFEIKDCKGLFVTGELIDVDGICGGYNLQWAFSTGYIAGNAASEK